MFGLHVVANSSSNNDGPSAAILFPRRSFEIGSKRSLSSASGLFVLLHRIAKEASNADTGVGHCRFDRLDSRCGHDAAVYDFRPRLVRPRCDESRYWCTTVGRGTPPRHGSVWIPLLSLLRRWHRPPREMLGPLGYPRNFSLTAGMGRASHCRHASSFFLPYSLINQSSLAVGGQSHCNGMCWRSPRYIGSLLAAQGVVSTWYVARLRDARQWNSLVNVKREESLRPTEA